MATQNIFKTADEVLTAMADFFVKSAGGAITGHGRFTVALSGGNSPKKLFELLSSAAYKDKVEWPKVYFFFGDERNVPQDDPESNSLMAQKALFDPLKISHTQIFKVNTRYSPDEAATAYTDDITYFFDKQKVVFDLILLGLGDNSHTASLFPHTQVLHDTTASVSAVYVKELDTYRITFTASLINQAHQIAFLVYGAGKAEAVHHVLQDERNTEVYPAQMIRNDEDVFWFMDEPAAAMLAK